MKTGDAKADYRFRTELNLEPKSQYIDTACSMYMYVQYTYRVWCAPVAHRAMHILLIFESWDFSSHKTGVHVEMTGSVIQQVTWQ